MLAEAKKFEDLPATYFENHMESWVVPKLEWFRNMALKVLRDKAETLRNGGQIREALASCQKALQMDAVCEIADAEAMRIFHAQKPADAMELEPETDMLDMFRLELVNSHS